MSTFAKRLIFACGLLVMFVGVFPSGVLLLAEIPESTIKDAKDTARGCEVTFTNDTLAIIPRGVLGGAPCPNVGVTIAKDSGSLSYTIGAQQVSRAPTTWEYGLMVIGALVLSVSAWPTRKRVPAPQTTAA